MLDFERRVKGRKIDVFYEDMGILIENKSRGCSLDDKYERSKKVGAETPYEQAKWYADNLPYSIRPRWIVTCNFDEIRIHDLDKQYPGSDYVSASLDELPDMLYLFRFFTDKDGSRIEREKRLSVKAGELVGRLYDGLSSQYQNIDPDKHEQRSLNVLCVRLVFLLYAEVAAIFVATLVVLPTTRCPLGFCVGKEPYRQRRKVISVASTVKWEEAGKWHQGPHGRGSSGVSRETKMNRFGKKAAVVFAVAFVAFAAVLAGCAEEGSSGKADAAGDYRRVSQAEAAEMMKKETGYLILDVRTEEEFAQGHIPGAVNVPVETIGNEPPTQLPDKDQLIMVYCRSGNRSVTASEKLAALGYTNIVEFGGINTWPGEIVTSSM